MPAADNVDGSVPPGPERAPSAVDFQAVFAHAPTAYLVMDTDLVIVAANEAYLRLLGRAAKDLVGRPVFEAFPPDPATVDEAGRHPVRTSFERARDSGGSDVLPLLSYDVLDESTGIMVQRYWSLVSAAVLDSAGRTCAVLQQVQDVSDYVRERSDRQNAQERGHQWQQRVQAVEANLFARIQDLAAAQAERDLAAHRLASLAAAALKLTSADTVEDLERIVIGEGLTVLGASGGAVLSLAGDGGWRLTTNAALGPRVQLDYAYLPADSPMPAVWSARTGQRLLLADVASGLAFDAVMAEVYAQTGRAAWAFLPLIIGTERLGVLAVAWVAEQYFTPDVLELLDGFAAQCAQALQRIRVTAAQQAAAAAAMSLSEALQRSLLTRPPTPASLKISVRYHPAAHAAQIGGDFYDAFLTSDGSTVLVIGDVNGHDRDAAATMGQVRNLLRGIAYDSLDSPAQLLTRLDTAMLGLRLDSLTTAVLARISPLTDPDGARSLRWSNAGHPPPMLRYPDGRVQHLTAEPNLLLGIDATTRRSDQVVTLPPGSTLLLYTDGLVEEREHDIDRGIARLGAFLGTHGHLDPEQLCDLLLEQAIPRRSEDDIAVLALCVGDPPSD